MGDPRQIACTECDFLTRDPEEMATHMLSSRHCIDPDLADDTDSGFFAFLVEGIRLAQTHPEMGTPVSEDDDDDDAA